jgi:hypothetical protein
MGYLESLDYCGFFEAVPPIGSGVNNSRTCTVSPFTNGPFGRFYLNNVADGGNLLRGDDASPTNGGTGTASENGVYHRTVDPSASTGEGSSEVSIGYHYPPYPQPDLDGNGVADVDEDTDGDGLPDAWELEYELNHLDSTLENGLAGDPDYDGFTNQEEYELGGSPFSPAKSGDQLVFRIREAALRVDGIADSEDLGTGEFCEDESGNPDPQIVSNVFAVGSLDADCYALVVSVKGLVECTASGFDKVSIESFDSENELQDTELFIMGGRETPEQEALCDEPCKMLLKQNTKVILAHKGGWIHLVYDTVDGLYHKGAFAEVIDVSLIKVDITEPAQDFLWQGDTKTLNATIQPLGRAIQWSVSPSDKLDITETGTLFFKPYGDTCLSDFEVTVTAADSVLADCKDTQVIHVKGLKRPGSLTLQGTTVEEPAWVCASAHSVNGNDDSDSDNDTKTLGISYQSNDDECTGRVTKRQFKYKVEYILLTRINVDVLDFGDVVAAAVVYTAKNGVIQIQKSIGCASSDTDISISVGLISINVPCPGQDENNEQVTLSYSEIDNSEIAPHAPMATVDLSISLTGYGACETKGGWWSTAEAGAYLRPHALTSAEGQFPTLDAISFKPKAPDIPLW